MLKSKTLQMFADDVDQALIKGGTSLVREVCRHITGSNPKIAAFMASKLVEWRYGKATETVINEERKAIEPGTDFFQAEDTTGLGKPN